jgi:hypothetical protein
MMKQAEVLRLLFVHVAVDDFRIVYGNVRIQGYVSLEPVVFYEKNSVKDWRDQALEYV